MAFAQAIPNLVPNPSFVASGYDTTISGGCIIFGGGFYYTPPWRYFDMGGVAVWTFDSCSISLYTSLPLHIYGYQVPHSGPSFVGIPTYSDSAFCSNCNNRLRAYHYAPLLKPLRKKRSYCLELFANRTDSSNYSCSNLGAYFSRDTLTYDSLSVYHQMVIPQVDNNPIQNPLTSFTDWVRIAGKFTARGGEKYITLGNFTPQHLCTVTRENPNISRYSNTWLYVDDVSLVELRNFNGPDTLYVCPNKDTLVSVFDGIDSVLWSTGDTGKQITITQPGTYWVYGHSPCGSVTDTITVIYRPAQDYIFSLGSDTAFCDSVHINLGLLNPRFNQFLWSNGDTTQNTILREPGPAWLRATGTCNTFTDSVFLTLYPSPAPDLENVYTHCLGSSSLLSPGTFDQYLWSNGDTLPELRVNQPGSYSVLVKNSLGCKATDTALVQTFVMQTNLLPADTSILPWDFPLQVHTLIPTALPRWNDGSRSDTIIIHTDGLYTLFTADALGCLLSDSIRISTLAAELFFPSLWRYGQTAQISNLPPQSTLSIFDMAGKVVEKDVPLAANYRLMLAQGMYMWQLKINHPSVQNRIISGKLMVVGD